MTVINLPKNPDGSVKAGPGRSKGSKNKSKLSEVDLEQAMSLVSKRRRKSFLVHLVEQAYKDNRVAVALAKKLLPDLKSTELGIAAGKELSQIMDEIAAQASGGGRTLPSHNDD
jgi:hypothetical protein